MKTEKTYRVTFDLTEQGIEVLYTALIAMRSQVAGLNDKTDYETVVSMMDTLKNGGGQ